VDVFGDTEKAPGLESGEGSGSGAQDDTAGRVHSRRAVPVVSGVAVAAPRQERGGPQSGAQ
jgi:hypothetical protein